MTRGLLGAALGCVGLAWLLLAVGDSHADDAVGARLRAERMPFDLTVTASMGICTGPMLTEAHWKMLYRFADRALFEAKAEGRDRARAAYSVAYAA